MAFLDRFPDLFSRYWYVFLIIGAIIIIYIYSRLDAYTKSKIRKIFSKKVIFVILGAGGWYIWHKIGDMTTVSEANRWMPVILLLILTAYNYIGALRYETQQIITPNFHGSYSKSPLNVNGFLIFSIDSFNAGGLSWDYAKRILVVREETVELLDRGAISIARVKLCSIYQLDDDVKSVIESNKFLKGGAQEIYYGWFDDIEEVDYNFKQLKNLEDIKNKPEHIFNLIKKEFGVNNPSIKTLYWLYRNECKARGKQTEQYDSTVEAVEKGVEHHKRVKDAYVDKPEPSQRVGEGHEEY